ncbi:DUF2231 domain-containing protein [Solicola gregarius]|uniref:Uncharacterized protein n=1 Tax=Solicola gregarius TaxID=2908642 RepID=A0AA46TFH2_9ACTN|nr:DUF2231 domain-containing protein [Solicola gregarius]UYM04374.1 hypothetical protein L0C25_17810 [Solicola gregarius]
MGPVEINGLPAHVLLVHLTIVLIPAAAACVVLSAWWPRARRWLGVLTPLACLAALAMVPITTNAGEWLEERLGGEAPLIERHEELGKLMLWWAIALAVVGVVQWAWHRWYARGSAGARVDRQNELVGARASSGPGGDQVEFGNGAGRTSAAGRATIVGVVIGLIATAVAVGSVVHLVRVGESGSRAVWEGSYSTE